MPEDEAKKKTFTELSGDDRLDVRDIRYLSNRFRDKALSWAEECDNTTTIRAAAETYREAFGNLVGQCYKPTTPDEDTGIILDAQSTLEMGNEICQVVDELGSVGKEPSPDLRMQVFDQWNSRNEPSL